MTSIWQYVILGLKGFAMGAANVIPGVSGGTIALITGIFERLIDALKSFNLTALKLFFTGRWKQLARHIDLNFLLAVFSGVGISIFSLAKLLKFLFENYPVLVWAYFFGLILASVYFVGKTISKWSATVVIITLIGISIAAAISLFKPAQENSDLYYLLICGVVAVCSMIIPGLSGSFVLILLGNYHLIMIDAVTGFHLNILIPVVIGAVVGLLAFAHILSWIFKKFRNQTIGLLTGFMAGSLIILWPWKKDIYSIDELGNFILDRNGEQVLEGYSYNLPDFQTSEFWIAVVCIIVGILSIAIIEWQGKKMQSKES